jgi:hypothetical protein
MGSIPEPASADSEEFRGSLEGTCISTQTFLANDYLNTYNEVVMLLEMVPDMPDVLEDLKEWTAVTYHQHFEASGLSENQLAIEAYERAPARFRRPFDGTIEQMKLVIASSVDRVEQALAAGESDQLRAIAVGASQVVGKLIDVAGAIVHGSEATHDQAEIDSLLGD